LNKTEWLQFTKSRWEFHSSSSGFFLIKEKGINEKKAGYEFKEVHILHIYNYNIQQ